MTRTDGTGTVGVDDGDPVKLAPSDAELERAIASVPGVASAAIDRDGATGGSRLRLRLGNGEDAQTIAWAVAATLRERFGIAVDPDAIRARSTSPVGGPEDDPVRLVHAPHDHADHAGSGGHAEPGADGTASDLDDTRQRLTEAAHQALEGVEVLSRRTAGDVVDQDPTRRSGEARWSRTVGPERARVEIRDLDVRSQDERVRAVATLGRCGEVGRGLAGSVATTQGSYRAVAEATIDALRGLTATPLHAGVDRITVQPADDPTTAAVVLSVLTGTGALTHEEQLVGASMVRGDPQEAVMRATLDALNRRLIALLPAVDDDLAGDGPDPRDGAADTPDGPAAGHDTLDGPSDGHDGHDAVDQDVDADADADADA